MAELTDTDRVAVYIDFDNIVISRYDQLHGDGAWRKDKARDAKPATAEKLATVPMQNRLSSPNIPILKAPYSIGAAAAGGGASGASWISSFRMFGDCMVTYQS